MIVSCNMWLIYNFWFIHSICPSVYRWKDIDNFVSIPNILFSFLVNSAINYGSLSNTILSGNLCSFHTLPLNNLTNPSTNVSSVVVTKCVIFHNLLQTTRIASFSATNSNFMMKSTVKYIYGFSSTSLNFNFSADISILFFILWHLSQLSIYLPISLVTPGHQ